MSHSEKKDEGPAMRVVINRGQRTYRLKAGPSGEARVLRPGQSIEVDAAEHKQLSSYRDVVDAEKAVPQAAEAHRKLRDENARLEKENAELRKDAGVEPEPVREETQSEEAQATAPKHHAAHKPAHRKPKGKKAR